jgi:hypothetical protein
MIDLPATVRLKTSIIKLLPYEPQAMNDKIRDLCAGAHRGMDISTCYASFYSREAANAVAAKERCDAFTKRVAADKDWKLYKADPAKRDSLDGFTYIGSDKDMWEKYGFLTFYPATCEALGLKNGQVRSYGLNP